MKQKQLNLILGVVAMAMLGGVLLAQKKTPAKTTALTALSADAVSKIAIKHPGQPEIDLEKKNGAWMLTAPVAVAADPFEVKSLTDLASTEVRSSIDDLGSVKLKDFGFDPPGYQIVLNEVTLDFGGTEPLRYQRYIKTGGHVALIDDPQSPALDADYSDLVSKRLLPEGADIAKIEVPGLTVAREATGPGWTSLPVDESASSDRLQKFAEAWREARATWNQIVPAADPPAKNPEIATVTLKDGTALPFRIVSREPQLVLERSDLKVRYALPKTAVDQLLKLSAAPAADKAAEKPADVQSGASLMPPLDSSGSKPAR